MTTSGGEHLLELLARAEGLRGDAPFLAVADGTWSARVPRRRALCVASGLASEARTRGLRQLGARLDRMPEVAGHRVSPDEVAQALHGLADAGARGGAQGRRIVVEIGGCASDAELPRRVLRQRRARLPAYMVPAAVRVHRALPHHQNGKIDVARLEREDPWNAPS